MPSGLTQVTAANLCDATGTKIVNAIAYFQPVLSNGSPTSFQIGVAGGGAVSFAPVQVHVAAGALSIYLADTSLTSPVNIGYALTVIDVLTGDSLLGPGYSFLQPSGPTWSLDAFQPGRIGASTLLGMPTFAIGTVATGTVASVTLTGGPLAYLFNFVIPVGSGGSGATYPTAIVFADAGNGNRYSLSIKDGQRQETLVAGSTPLTTTPLVLIDGISGTHYQLQFNGGAFQWFPVASTVPGVASINLTDTDTATVKHWALVMNGAALQTASIL